MSHLIAAIDESARPRAYLMCATVVSTADRHHIRRALRGLLLPNQRRLHAYSERDGRRRTVLKTIAELSGVQCHLLLGRSRDERHRGECIRALAHRLVDMGVAEIVIERIDDGNIRRDAQAMVEVAQRHGRDFQWRHEPAMNEPLLWISDFVLWAYGAGGDMRRAAETIISAVQVLEE